MDVNAGKVLDGVSLDAVGDEIFDLVLRVASGERSKSECIGAQQRQDVTPGQHERIRAVGDMSWGGSPSVPLGRTLDVARSPGLGAPLSGLGSTVRQPQHDGSPLALGGGLDLEHCPSARRQAQRRQIFLASTVVTLVQIVKKVEISIGA